MTRISEVQAEVRDFCWLPSVGFYYRRMLIKGESQVSHVVWSAGDGHSLWLAQVADLVKESDLIEDSAPVLVRRCRERGSRGKEESPGMVRNGPLRQLTCCK